MKQQEMRKPLIQSGLVLLAIIVLIGFVAGSNAHGVFGGIISIFKGALYSVLFVIGLALALTISVAILIGIYLGAVAMYSPETSKETYASLRTRVLELYSTWCSCNQEAAAENPVAVKTTPAASVSEPQAQPQPVPEPQPEPQPEPPAETVAPDALQAVNEKLQGDIDGVANELKQVTESGKSLESSLTELKSSIDQLPIKDISEKTETLSAKQDEFVTGLSDTQKSIDSLQNSVTAAEKLIQQQAVDLKSATETIASYEAQLAELRDKVEAVDAPAAESAPAEPEEQETETGDEHRIFTYLEKDEDKEKFASLVAEAVEKNMTYAEIDEFLTKSLTKKLDDIIKDHPSLTKDYIRECKKK